MLTRKRINPISTKQREKQRELARLVPTLLARSRGYCEANCGRRGMDPHHVIKRSQGGDNSLENLVWLCRYCHDATDAPYARGRLAIHADGAGGFVYITNTVRRVGG